MFLGRVCTTRTRAILRWGTWIARHMGMRMCSLPRLAIVLWFSMLLGNAHISEATCVDDGQSPCYRYWHTDAVLLGEVRSKIPLTNDSSDSSSRLRVAVVEAFRGIDRTESLVTIDIHSGECGVDAEVGQQILFYADREKEGTLRASMHSVPFEDSEADLTYARLASAHAASAMVYGVVERRDTPDEDGSSFTALSGVIVRARGKNFDAETATDADGHYSMSLPGGGRYELAVVSPIGMAVRIPAHRSFELTNDQECFSADFQLLTNGRIRGVVLDDETKRPVPNLVLGTGDDNTQSKTDGSGVFDIGPLSDGEYQLEAATGTGSVTLQPGTVTVSSGQATLVGTVLAHVSRPLVSVTFDLTGLSADDCVELRLGSIAIEMNRDRDNTFALEPGVPLELHWSTGQEMKTTTLSVDADVRVIKLSRVTWRALR